ncbi:hypothetical protein [Nonomuraea sp. NPDC049758]|uniref:hypothetical protein n=1 Tax=Nonomuraea sp. NPDC049758 TaxID=3154360 RepID=UPI00341DDBE4
MIVTSGSGSGRACDRARGPLPWGGFTQESAVVRALPETGADQRDGVLSALDPA